MVARPQHPVGSGAVPRAGLRVEATQGRRRRSQDARMPRRLPDYLQLPGTRVLREVRLRSRREYSGLPEGSQLLRFEEIARLERFVARAGLKPAPTQFGARDSTFSGTCPAPVACKP